VTAIDIALSGVGGEYMESAVLVEWRAAEGARVAAGDVVCVVETAKAATEVEAPADGVLHIMVPVGDEVAVGTVLARVSATRTAILPRVAGDGDIASPATAGHEALINSPPQRRSGMPRRWPAAYASPLAKRLSVERGIDLRSVRGSGPGGRIVQADVTASEAMQHDWSDCFSMSVALDAAALFRRRAERWDGGEYPSIGEIVADAARVELFQQSFNWPVVVLCDNAPPRDALAVIDVAAFGIADFRPPRLCCRAALGLSTPASGTLRLSLTARARDFSCIAAARFLAALRSALETDLA